MFAATFRSLLAHRARLVLTALAIALGTAFMAGSFVFTATLSRSLDSLFAQSATGTDVIVRHATPPGANFGAGSGSAKPVPASIASTVRGVAGVAADDGVVSGRAVLLGRDGKPLPGQFAVALSWPQDSPFQAIYTHRSGQPPSGPGEVMIDRGSAQRGHFAVGDRVEVAVGGQARPFTITGITGYGSADSIGGGSMAIFSLSTAQRLFSLEGRFSQILVKAANGVSAQQLSDRVAGALPPGAVAVTAASAAASQAQQLNSQLSFLTYFFAGFAGVSLFVGAFVIWNTFSIMVGQRIRELALLRALGGGRGQVFRSVLGEAALVGIAGAFVGVLLGVALARGLAALLATFGASLPISGLVVPVAGVALSFGAGLVVTIVAAVPPAWRATGVAPVQALRDAVPAESGYSLRRLIVGLAMLTAGVAAAAVGLFGAASASVTGVGAAFCFLGVTILSPLFARPLAAAVGLPLAAAGSIGALARGNAMRSPKRTSATAAALMIGLALIVAASVLVGSVRSVIGGQITGASKTSFYVQATNTDAGITPALASALTAVPGVEQVTQVRTTDATVAGSAHQNVDGIDQAAIGAFASLGVTSGSVASLASGMLLVSKAVASAHGWQVGDAIRVGFGSYGVSTLRIGGIFADTGPLSSYLISLPTFAADTGIRTDTVDLVRAPSSARRALLRALAGYPGAQLLDQAGYAKSRESVLGTILNLITALLVLAVIIALLGIASTLALSVTERTRELGLLRAVGMRRGQVARMIAGESLIIAIIGALTGTALGLGLGAALAAAFTRSQQLTVVVPGGQVAAYVAAAALAGLLAALVPARRAARMNMIAALAAE
jgi:putative ABC transport system permease protein